MYIYKNKPYNYAISFIKYTLQNNSVNNIDSINDINSVNNITKIPKKFIDITIKSYFKKYYNNNILPSGNFSQINNW